MRLALRHKEALEPLGTIQDAITWKQGRSFGAVWTVYHSARRLGIAKALGPTRDGTLALGQGLARGMAHGSRLSAVRLARPHAACEVLGVGPFDEEALDEKLGWPESKPQWRTDSLPRAPRASLSPCCCTMSRVATWKGHTTHWPPWATIAMAKQASARLSSADCATRTGRRSLAQCFPALLQSPTPWLRTSRRSRSGVASPRSPAWATVA
jgi:hypothetical protein